MWDLGALTRTPDVVPAGGREEFEEEGLRALFFDGPAWKGRRTRVFAWYGVPGGLPAAAGRRFPAMVLVHGGGGTAFARWVRLWNQRGYAAIAMDTCGSIPVGGYGKWERHEDGGPPGWGGFARVDDPPTDQWAYHAVADVLLGHSLIRSLPEVDAERVGVTGISWGGYLTCIVAGVDPRFRFAAPVYGCGCLGDDSGWLNTFAEMGEEKAGKWLRRWDPSLYLPSARLPMLWVDGTNDQAYPLNSVQRSCRLPPGPRLLCTRVRMAHGHEPGEAPEEIRAFADSKLRGGLPLATIVEQGRTGRRVWAAFDAEAPIERAELNVTKDVGPWTGRWWDTVPAAVDPPTGRVSAELPEGTTAYYLNLIDDRELIVSTEHVETDCD